MCDLIEPVGLAQPTVSHHMKKLLDAGLVEREQRGKWAYFSLNRDAVAEARRRRRPERSVLLMSTTSAEELREEVRRRYAESARAVTEGSSCGCGSGSCCDGESDAAKFGEALYDAEQRGELPETAALASLGCGNPTAVAEINEGETVLDLGSGGGIDVILSAKRVGETGFAYGLDMTDEMLALARRNAAEAGIRERDLPEGRDRGGAAAGRLGRRRDLELRDQPLGRQAGRARGDLAGAEAGRADRDQRRRRRGSPLGGGSGRARQLRRLHRRRALEGRVRGGARGGRLRADQRRVHPRGRRRNARRDRQGGEDRRRPSRRGCR